MCTSHRSRGIGFKNFLRLSNLPFKPHVLHLWALALVFFMAAAPAAHSEDILDVFDPDYSDCGKVSVNGVVITDPPTAGLVWDWGDGSKTAGWFPAAHRYSANGTYTVTVTAAGCSTLVQTTTAEIANVEPACPPAGAQTNYYLLPYNVHLTAGMTGAGPLHVVDQDGNPVSGSLSFTTSDPQDLVSISASGLVTALRTEAATEIGVWINATLDGQPVSNACVVRVLSNDYSAVPFAEASTARTTLYYPAEINGEDIAAAVDRFEMATVNEYAYQIQARLMGTSPFQGGRQIWEVDFGTTEENRVCGISGNPIRLGWNTGGDPWNPWQNCFLVPWPTFAPDRSPQWGVLYHELGHNMTWNSQVFGMAMDHFLYSEGLATAMGLAVMEEVLGSPEKYPLGEDAYVSLDWICYISNEPGFLQARQNWLDGGGVFANLNPDAVDGIWLYHKNGVPHFADRFFLPMQPLMVENLREVLCQVQAGGDGAKHTFFAALMSAAAGTDLYAWFEDTYHYPLVQPLYESALTAFSGIIAQRECPGDFDKDGSSDASDLAVFALDFSRAGCGGSSCSGDFDSDGDVDGGELATFILKFGRTDCL